MNQKPELFDVVELLSELPEYSLRIGNRGAIVHCHPDGEYEVEFANKDGETVALCSLSSEQFHVVWRAKTKSWVPLPEQVTAVVTYLPERAEREILNFARYLLSQERATSGSVLTPASEV